MSDVTEALEDAHNLAVLGATQTGKTSFARELHAETPRVSIWLNERGSHRVPGVKGSTYQSLDGVQKAFGRDEYRIEFVPEDRREAVVRLREWLWRVSDAVDRSLPIQVVADEVDRLAEQSNAKYGNLPARDAVRDFTSEGVKRNLKWVGITQDPASYDKRALRQSRYRAVWPMSTEQQSAVSEYGFQFDQIRTAAQYTGVLHHMDGRTLGEVRAAEEYAE